MFGLLHQYLVENRSVYLRGTGQLQLVQQPASFDVADQVLQPPQTNIQLLPGEQAGSLQPLVSFISSQLQLPEEKAISLYESFCNHLQEQLTSHSVFNWNNFGVFTKDAGGSTCFQPDERLAQYQQPVSANRVLRQNTTHNMMVGTRETTNTAMREMLSEQVTETVQSRWWIPALVLGVASLLLILLKKMQYL